MHFSIIALSVLQVKPLIAAVLHPQIIHRDEIIPRQAPDPPLPDGYTPHAPPINWLALGDSYTAGPGAGNSFDNNAGGCFRNQGSYAYQLNQIFPWHEAQSFSFIACTGYQTPDVIEKTIPLIPNQETDFMVMTLGGNDIGFSGILKACLVRPNPLGKSCADAITEAENKIGSPEFQTNLTNVWDGLFDKMAGDYRYHVYHLLYSRFFNSGTPWCNDQSFGFYPGISPKLTAQLRATLNVLVNDANSRIKQIARQYVLDKKGGNRGGQLVPPAPGFRDGNRLYIIEPDNQVEDVRAIPYALFDDHRFCESGVESLKDDSIWFFTLRNDDAEETDIATFTQGIDPTSCISDPKYESDIDFEYGCDIAIYINSPGIDKEALSKTALPEKITQAFHPKTVGFAAIRRLMSNILRKARPPIGNTACADQGGALAGASGGDFDVTIQVGTASDYVASTTCNPLLGASAISASTDTSAPPPSDASPTPTSSTPPLNNPPPPAPTSSAPPARTCDVDCGSELPPHGSPACFCTCSDGTRFRITNGSPPCK